MSNVPSASRRPASFRPPPPRPVSVRPAPPRPAARAEEVEELRTMDLTVVAAELAKSIPPPLPSSIPPPPRVPALDAAPVATSHEIGTPAPAAETAAVVAADTGDPTPMVSPFAPPSLLVRLRSFVLAAASWTLVVGVYFGYLARAAWVWVRSSGLPGVRAIAASARGRASLEWSRAKEHPSATRR